MARLAIAFFLLVIAASLVAIVLAMVSRAVQRAGDGVAKAPGASLQKISFFLLLCLMIYVAASGAG